MNWDDLRYLLAVSSSGTLSGAARFLGVSQTTVTRRLKSLEDQVGMPLFERIQRGVELTPSGVEFLQTAKEFEQQLLLLDAKVKGQETELQGVLCVTMLDFLSVLWSDVLHDFIERYPGLRLEVRTDPRVLDLFQREADIAIRLARAPDERLVGRKIARVGSAVYVQKSLFKAYDESKDLNVYPWLGESGGGDAPPASWRKKHAPDARVVTSLDSFFLMVEYLQSGTGIGILPCMVGDRYPTLQRLQEVDFELYLWMLTHPELRYSPKVRAFFDHMLMVFSKWKARIEG